MCGRYTAWMIARTNWRGYAVEEHQIPEAAPLPTYNAAPGQMLPVIDARGWREAKWGITASFSPRPMVNATAEKLTGRFWASLMQHRCLVPANGYFEWDAVKQPWYFMHRDLPVICFAGLMDGGSFAVITIPSNDDAAPVHDRMPAIIEPESASAWLDPAIGAGAAASLIFAPPAGTLQRYPVSRAVGSVKNNGPELIAPLAA